MRRTPRSVMILLAVLGAGVVAWCPPATAIDRNTLDRLAQIVETLGMGAGVAVVCSQSPTVETEDSLAWARRMLTLEDLAMKYTEHLAPGDEIAVTATMLALATLSAELQEAPQRVWDDPQGCVEETRQEIDDMIRVARCGLRSTTQRVLDLLLSPRLCHP